jgi:hypothetical protein
LPIVLEQTFTEAILPSVFSVSSCSVNKRGDGPKNRTLSHPIAGYRTLGHFLMSEAIVGRMRAAFGRA